MFIITLQEAQANLAELVHRLAPGEAVTITENDQPIAQLIPVPHVQQRPSRPRPPVTGVPKAGQYEGRLVVPDDFEEPLEEMREYME
jgi:prevent-host-death family protein